MCCVAVSRPPSRDVTCHTRSRSHRSHVCWRSEKEFEVRRFRESTSFASMMNGGTGGNERDPSTSSLPHEHIEDVYQAARSCHPQRRRKFFFACQPFNSGGPGSAPFAAGRALCTLSWRPVPGSSSKAARTCKRGGCGGVAPHRRSQTLTPPPRFQFAPLASPASARPAALPVDAGRPHSGPAAGIRPQKHLVSAYNPGGSRSASAGRAAGATTADHSRRSRIHHAGTAAAAGNRAATPARPPAQHPRATEHRARGTVCPMRHAYAVQPEPSSAGCKAPASSTGGAQGSGPSRYG